MADFRATLYEKYVSSFKDELGPFNIASYWKWCDHKLKPWLGGVPTDGSILELGCGPGYLLGYFTSLGYPNAEGIDVSAEQVELARAAGHRATVADVFDAVESAVGKYDLIIAFDFLEHFTREELGRLVDGLRTALKPGGLFIAQTPNGEGLHPQQIIYGDLTHSTILTPTSFRQLFRLGGFVDFAFRETGPMPNKLSGAVRTVLWKLIRLKMNFLRLVEAAKTQQIWTENMLCLCRRPAVDAEGPHDE